MRTSHLTAVWPEVTLPPQALEPARVHRVAGLTGARTALVTTRPFRAPHHTTSDVGLIGGGPVPMPGEVSLAHHGVLVLDEGPECWRPVLEVLRQLIETGGTHRRSRERPRRRWTHGTGCMGDARAARHERVSVCPQAPSSCRLAERFAVV
jgi:predicted ATPase with chaperone activity